LDKRKADIKDRLKKEEIDAIVEKLRDRLAKLENKIAVFRIGGATETEREEKEYRVEDAIQSTRAAASYGVVTGGGITFLKLAETEGISDLSKEALQELFKKLMENANLPADVKLHEAEEAPDGYGFNLKTGGELVDLVKDGILDATLVIEQVIYNAVSTAANAVTIGAMITFIDKEK
jgi:chaperonin GroEL